MPFIKSPLDPTEPTLWEHCSFCLGIWHRKEQMGFLLEKAKDASGHSEREAFLLSALNFSHTIQRLIQKSSPNKHELNYRGARRGKDGIARLGDIPVASPHIPAKEKALNILNRAKEGAQEFIRYGRNALNHASPPPEAPLVFPMKMVVSLSKGTVEPRSEPTYLRFYEDALCELDPMPELDELLSMKNFVETYRGDLEKIVTECVTTMTTVVEEFVRHKGR